MPEFNLPYLSAVHLTADVYASCLQHAFTTEKEEVMGLLIGEVNEENRTSHISACLILHRSDKQPDRVEISPEQLSEATSYAEELAHQLKRPMRVVGWYHSHPHITVWPSHVDVRTQAMYQQMDHLFVGLIFSVFAGDTGSVVNKVELTCFQAVRGGVDPQRRDIPLEIKPSPLENHNLQVLIDLPRILTQEVLQHSNETSNNQDELAKLHKNAMETMTLSHIVSKITLPMAEDFLQRRLKTTEARLRELQLRKQEILTGKS